MVDPRPGPTRAFVLLASSLALSSPLHGADDLQVSRLADVRGTTKAANPLEADSASAQIQAGVDWSPSPYFLAHLHLLARTDDGHSQRGHVGTAFWDEVIQRLPSGPGPGTMYKLPGETAQLRSRLSARARAS